MYKLLAALVVIPAVALMNASDWRGARYADNGGAVAKEKASCVLATEWVAANWYRLPQSTDEFAKYDMPYRKAIYAGLDADARLSLWREHTRRVAAEHKPSEQQLKFIVEAMDALQRRLAVSRQPVRRGSAEEKALIELSRRGQLLFGPATFSRYFGQLGGVPVAESRTGVQAVEQNCNCESSGSDPEECEIPNYCNTTSNCKTVEWHCGFLFLFDCDGFCRAAQ